MQNDNADDSLNISIVRQKEHTIALMAAQIFAAGVDSNYHSVFRMSTEQSVRLAKELYALVEGP